MTWLGYARQHGVAVAECIGRSTLSRGTLLIDIACDVGALDTVLMSIEIDGQAPFFSWLETQSGGSFVWNTRCGGDVHSVSVATGPLTHLEPVRLLLSWDNCARQGRLSLMRAGQLVPVSTQAPGLPVFGSASVANILRGLACFLAGDVRFVALSSGIEPSGPMPSIASGTLIETQNGSLPIEKVHRGHAVRCHTGGFAPVLHRVDYTAPACGSFAPIRLRAPYFGLSQDIVVAPDQQIVLQGSDVEYAFGKEAVLTSARSVVNGHAAQLEAAGSWVTYHQLVLPSHHALKVANAGLASLYVGRLRRKPEVLAQSALNGLDRLTLPEHAEPAYPMLRPFEAKSLMDIRAA